MFFLKARTDISEEKAVMRRDVSEKWGSRIDYKLPAAEDSDYP